MKKSIWRGIPMFMVTMVCSLLFLPTNTNAQGLDTMENGGLKYFISSGGLVFFYEDGNNPNTGLPMPPPSIPLAPITELKIFEFEAVEIVIPAKTFKEFLQIDFYLRQRYYYNNYGQGYYQAWTNPFIEIESAAFPNKIRYAVQGNGLHLDERKMLNEGEWGNNSRGNYGRDIWSKEAVDRWLGPGKGDEFFKNDITIHLILENKVIGLTHYVAGITGHIYGY